MSEIDWSKAPKWAGAVVQASLGAMYWVVQFGGISPRQRLTSDEPDDDIADMQYPHSWKLIAERNSPQDWTGTGLPPVGTVCDLDCSGSYQGQVEILFINKDVAVCRNLDDDRTQWGGVEFEYRFRPIKTQAQIEAEAREAAIQKMRECLEIDEAYTIQTIMEALYDAGCRLTKQDGE